MRNKNIHEGKRIILFHFHHKLYRGENAIEMLEKGIKGGLTVRPNDEGIVDKT
jgi:hypothetical protein